MVEYKTIKDTTFVLEDGQDDRIHYLGNKKIKRDGVKIAYTSDQLIELDKCEKDIIYFCENYIKIINVDKGLIPFKMYDFQKDMLRQFENNRFNIVKCPRQVGKCVFINTTVRLRNKKTGEILETTVGDLYEKVSKLSKRI